MRRLPGNDMSDFVGIEIIGPDHKDALRGKFDRAQESSYE